MHYALCIHCVVHVKVPLCACVTCMAIWTWWTVLQYCVLVHMMALKHGFAKHWVPHLFPRVFFASFFFLSLWVLFLESSPCQPPSFHAHFEIQVLSITFHPKGDNLSCGEKFCALAVTLAALFFGVFVFSDQPRGGGVSRVTWVTWWWPHFFGVTRWWPQSFGAGFVRVHNPY